MSQSIRHLKLVLPKCRSSVNTMASTVTRAQSNRTPLGCSETEDLQHKCEQNCSNYVVRSVSSTWLNTCHEEFRLFQGQMGGVFYTYLEKGEPNIVPKAKKSINKIKQ